MEAIREHPALQVQLQYHGLVPDQLWDRLVARIQKDNPLLSKEWAEMIMDGALGFLKLCADFPGNGFAPSKMVDIGWHTFLMYTKEYQEFCQRVAGHFIHHVPNDIPGREGSTAKSTRVFMDGIAMVYNPSVWGKTAECGEEGDCGMDHCETSCDEDGGCQD
ncbi:MAG: hypothetical protein Q8Q95_00010 [bacterium]|nr:hypothetical protein [bacterium]